MNQQTDKLQLLHMNWQRLRADIDSIGTTFDINDLLPSPQEDFEEQEEPYYLQYPLSLRQQATEMARYYRIFYCLENSIRDLVESQLEETAGDEWWEDRVPAQIKESVKSNINREKDNGVTLRSSHPIAYTTFGELSEIIKSNFEIFGATFNSQKGLEKVMSTLNLLRGPIAHCTPLAEDEVLRLHLAIRSFNRLTA